MRVGTDCLAQGVDLRVYSKQVEDELRQVERASVDDYIKESKNMANLHGHIQVGLSDFWSDFSACCPHAHMVGSNDGMRRKCDG